MAKQPKKKPSKTPKVHEDFAQAAFRVVQEATGAKPKTPDPDAGKDPKAVARGRKGGTKGGPIRAAKLSPVERAKIAKKAATARWKKPANDSVVVE
jgi:hypothetical protein